MDRAALLQNLTMVALLQNLTMVERHVAMGERHLAHQGALIADMDQKCEDSAQARAVLDTKRRHSTGRIGNALSMS